MYIFLKEIHLIIGIVLSILFLILVSYFLVLFFSKKSLQNIKKITFYTFLLTNLQFILGVVYYFFSPITKNFMDMPKIGMKDSSIRFFSLEHPLMMLFFVLFISLLNGAVKRDKKALAFTYLIISILFISYAFPFERILGLLE